MPVRPVPLFAALPALLTLLFALPLGAQPVQTTGNLQLGVGILPGLGTQIAYLSPGAFFVTEGIVYVDGVPGVLGGEGTVQLSVGGGGAIRTLGIARLFSEEGFEGYDVDFGVRFGPALAFGTDETRAEKNRRFSLFFDPYLRFVTRLDRRLVVFAEAGSQRPLLRGGLWVSF